MSKQNTNKHKGSKEVNEGKGVNMGTKSYFVIIMDSIAWVIGWTEGLVVGICVGCYEAEENLGLVEKLQDGCVTGFSEGEWLGKIDTIPIIKKSSLRTGKRKSVGKYVRFAK